MNLKNISVKSTGLKRLEVVSPEKFTTPGIMKIRRLINPIVRKIVKLSADKKIVVEKYPVLDDDTYIFATTHYFTEDIHASLGSLDRNAWMLVGTTDQLEHNLMMCGGWLNGIVYVDRNNDISRKNSLKKMEYVLNNGSSVLIFPEGGWNNTENLLVQQLFGGPYYLCCSTGKKVIPMATYKDEDNDIIYVRASEPIDLSIYDKKEALGLLRDSMATLMYEMIEKHSTPIKREELYGDYHLRFMKSRRDEYMGTPWTRDVWDEELTVYQDKSITTPQQIREVVDNISITAQNANIYAPLLVQREEDKKYDFKQYMKKNWNK